MDFYFFSELKVMLNAFYLIAGFAFYLVGC